ncbi:MAG: hypothetical protein JW702_02030 [Clostridiales bacterium]|nr:hypothetical protein [Clostridiales bacterium]
MTDRMIEEVFMKKRMVIGLWMISFLIIGYLRSQMVAIDWVIGTSWTRQFRWIYLALENVIPNSLLATFATMIAIGIRLMYKKQGN